MARNGCRAATATNTAVSATHTPTRTATRTATAVGPTVTPTRTRTRTATPTATATGSGASCSVLDTFNRANGAPGANWGGATSNFQIASNQLDVVNAGDAGPLLWSPTSFGATQQACVKLAAIDGNADDIALVLKAQSNTGLGNGLMEVLYDPTPGAIRIWTYDTTNDWVQRGSDLSATFAAGDTLRVVARSNGQVEIYKNTTLLGTRDASAWTYSAQGGYIGLLSYNGPNTLFDDFGGGTYAGASGPARADDPQPAAKALRQIAERQIAERQPAAQHPAALPPVVVDLGRVAERAAQAVADIQARAHTWGLRSAAAEPEPKGAAALFAPIQRAPLAVTPVSPIAGEVFRLYVSAGARPVAVRSIAAGGATSVQYLHPDHLGSIGQITDANRNWVQDVYFKPYGGVRWSQESGGTGPDSDSATRRSYTGQYEETSQWLGSLMHFKARYYSPFLHRFTQPDTIVPNPGNPQTLNRFSYVNNNPINYKDPTGHCATGMVWDSAVCTFALGPVGWIILGVVAVIALAVALDAIVAQAPSPQVAAEPVEVAPARDTTVLVPVQPAPRATEVKIGPDVAQITDTPEPEYIWRGTTRAPKPRDFRLRLGQDDAGHSFYTSAALAGEKTSADWVTAYSVSDLRNNGWVVTFDGAERGGPNPVGHVSIRLENEEKWAAWLAGQVPDDINYFMNPMKIRDQVRNTFKPSK